MDWIIVLKRVKDIVRNLGLFRFVRFKGMESIWIIYHIVRLLLDVINKFKSSCILVTACLVESVCSHATSAPVAIWGMSILPCSKVLLLIRNWTRTLTVQPLILFNGWIARVWNSLFLILVSIYRHLRLRLRFSKRIILLLTETYVVWVLLCALYALLLILMQIVLFISHRCRFLKVLLRTSSNLLRRLRFTSLLTSQLVRYTTDLVVKRCWISGLLL